MDDADRTRMAREASAIEQAVVVLAGTDPGHIRAPFVEGAAVALLTDMLERYAYLREWIDQAVRLAEARAAMQLAIETEGISSTVRHAFTAAMEREKRRMEDARYPSADDPAAAVRAYAAIAALIRPPVMP